ncbi:MAG: TadE family protein [Nitrospirota bacterium]
MDKKGKNGQSTVEFALLLPLLLMITVLIIEVSLLFHNYLIVTQLARESTRAGALGNTDDQIRDYVETGTSWLVNTHFLVGTISEISISPLEAVREQGGTLTVSIPYRVFISTPYFGEAIGMTMTASSTMRIER